MTNDLAKDKLSDLLETLSQRQFTGKLEVQALPVTWNIYFCLGRLVWIAGGAHRIRRWYRLLSQYCPQIPPKSIRPRQVDGSQSWKYQALTILVKQQKIQHEQAVGVIKSTIAEVLFDILQQEEKAPLTFICNFSDEQTILDSSLIPINPIQALSEAQQAWKTWCNAGLASVSPNMGAVIKHPEQLQQLASPQVYQTLVKLIDGKRSLRDMAVKVKQDELVLVRSLIPYIRKKAILLTNIPDFRPPSTPATTSPKANHSTPEVDASNLEEDRAVAGEAFSFPVAAWDSQLAITKPKTVRPLVAHVEDSLQERQLMQEILTGAKYGLLSIEDSMQALPLLLEHKPDLIFLDLVMPVANGYEICAQIRRISIFKDTPVIILTGNDGIVDRVRAKMVGATDFLAKPISEQKVLAALQKHLNSEFLTQNAALANLSFQTST
ncbi:MAG TPA: response regulator [Cyanobacteria bacterium UBA11372]|nr:response regulator [Cyanobacteria bacterium UBA11372]